MFGKIAFLVACVGVTACLLLMFRQQRLDAVHDMAVIQRRIAEHDRYLYGLRLRIAKSITPERIERLAAAQGPLSPMAPGSDGTFSRKPEPVRDGRVAVRPPGRTPPSP